MATATIVEGRPYSEVSPEAKEQAREWWRECERYDSFDEELLTECFQDILREDYGIEVEYRTQKISGSDKTIQVPEIYWDFGGYPEVSFKANIDLREFAKRENSDTIKPLLKAADMLKAVAFAEDDINWHVSMGKKQYNGVSVEFELYDNTDINLDILYEIKGDIESELSDIYKQACRHLARVGEKEIEYRDSDEYIEETIEANDYEFDEEGEFIG